MDVFSIIMLLGGLAFFLYGMNVMSSGLEKVSGGNLEKTLKKITDKPWLGLLLGMVITIAIQSSSAMTVMLVGLVNSSIMELSQTVAVIMGSNIGTTLTGWILSLIGIESGNVFLNLLKPENFSLIFALVGIIMIMCSKKKRIKDTGSILVGFAVLMFGMKLMSQAMEPLANMPQFAELMAKLSNPFLGVLVGAVFTGIIQSSAASVGILQSLALTGSITYGTAIPIIFGQNIGTCVTALLSSIGVNKNAKRVAVVHIAFNLIGTVACLALYYAVSAIFNITLSSQAVSPVGIAIVHTVFNIATTAMLFPFRKLLVKIANRVIKTEQGKDGEEHHEFLDDRLLATPSFAISECNAQTVTMCKLARETISSALVAVSDFSEDRAREILTNEDMLDMFEDKLGTVLVKLSSKDISMSDSKRISKMLHIIGDFERLGDHAVNLLKTAREINDKNMKFSAMAEHELTVLAAALREILDITERAYEQDDIDIAIQVEPLEQVIDRLILTIRNNHIERLRHGNCTIEMGFVLSDLLTNCERVSDHCSNIAVAIIEVEKECFDTHEYLSDVKENGNVEYDTLFKSFSAKYVL